MPASRALLTFAVRALFTCAVFAILFWTIDVATVLESLRRVPTLALLVALLAWYLAAFTGVMRWRLLLRAYGARSQPGWLELSRWYLVSMFYNLLPSAIGGDVYRGIATRHYMPDGSATRSVGVVLVERVLGVSGLLLLAACAALVSPRMRDEVIYYALLGLIAAVTATLALSHAHRLAPYLRGRPKQLAESLPRLGAMRPFLLSFAISLGSHLLVTLAGYVVAVSISPQLGLLDAMVIFPLSAFAAYFPATIAGAGARDAALVFLLAQVGVARSDALASSICLLLCHLVVSGTGGVLQRSSGSVALEAGAVES